jgi:hypothetical protein
MKEKLKELLIKADENAAGKMITDYKDAIDDIADYLLANGVVVTPCKVGDTVWFIRNGKIIETTVDKIVLKHRGLHLKLSCNGMYETSCNSIGKTVFLSREEAEAALKGGTE